MAKFPALFIERDGVLIHNNVSVSEKTQIRLIRNSGNALAEFNDHQIPVILLVEQQINNQTKLLTTQKAEEIETELKRKLKRLGAYYSLMYVYPEPGKHRNVDSTKSDIEFLFPNPYSIELISKSNNIDYHNSWIITDKFNTLLAAQSANMHGGIFVRTGNDKEQEKLLKNNLDSFDSLEIAVFSSLHIARSTILKYFKNYNLNSNQKSLKQIENKQE